MKTALITIALLLATALCASVSATAWAKPSSETLKAALESQATCSNFVRFDDDNVYLGFGNYRRKFEEPRAPIPAQIRVAPLAQPAQAFSLQTSDAAIDSVRDGSSLYVLTYSGIEEFNLLEKTSVAKYSTYDIGGVLAYMQHAQAFARYQDQLVIAHGRLGVSIFDLKTKRLVNQFRLLQNQLPLESVATGVTVVGQLAYVVMDNFSLVSQGTPAFRGLVVIDLNSQKVVAELSGMDPGADAAVADGSKLIVSFGGIPIWKYAVDDLRGTALAQPKNRIWKFPLDGQMNGQSNGHPVGKPSMDEKYYYTCFSKAPEKPGGHYTSVPLALDRHALLLD